MKKFGILGIFFAAVTLMGVSCKPKNVAAVQSWNETDRADYQNLLADLEKEPKCYEAPGPLAEFDLDDIAREDVEYDSLKSAIMDSPTVSCAEIADDDGQRVSGNELAQELKGINQPQAMNLGGTGKAARAFIKLAASKEGRQAAQGVLKATLKKLDDSATKTAHLMVTCNKGGALCSDTVKAFKQAAKSLAGKRVVGMSFAKQSMTQADTVVVPLGNSGALYTDAAGQTLLRNLNRIFAQAKGRVKVLMDFNHEGLPKIDGRCTNCLDINSAIMGSNGANHEIIGMTSKKVINGEYGVNAIDKIKNVLVSSADDYDTGFHKTFASMSQSLKTKFDVAIMGGGKITETQGQEWISALARGQKNVKIVMDIDLEAGKAAKGYNAAVRLLKANYNALQGGLANGQVQIFDNGRLLTQMPSQARIAEILSKLPPQ